MDQQQEPETNPFVVMSERFGSVVAGYEQKIAMITAQHNMLLVEHNEQMHKMTERVEELETLLRNRDDQLPD